MHADLLNEASRANRRDMMEVSFRRATRRRHYVGLALSFALATAAVLLAHEGHAPLPTSGTQVDLVKGLVVLSTEAREALDVRTAEVGTDPAPASVLGYATLSAPWQKHAFATSRLSGRIVTLQARPGQSVAAGDILAEVQSPELEQLRLDVLAARTVIRQSEAVLTGLKQSAGAVSGQEIADAEVKLQQDRLALDVSTAKWLALGLPADGLSGSPTSAPALPIRAPVGGTVIHADLAVGRVVEPGEHLFEVVDLSTVWARVGVLEQDLSRVAAGLPLVLQLTAYPGETFRGTVQVVGMGLDSDTHLAWAWAEFSNPPGREPRLLSGMSGQSRIELPAPTGTKTIPAEALVSDGVDRFVLVEVASASGLSEYQKKSVSILREGARVAIVQSSDLYPGDRVVTRGSHELGGLFAPGVVRLTAEGKRAIGLRTAAVGLHAVDNVVEVPGLVDLPPAHRTVASSPLAGTLVSVRVDRGARVEAGQVLGEVFSLEFQTLQLDLLKESLTADLLGQQLRSLKALPDGVSRRKVIDFEATHAASVQRRDSIRRRLTILGLTGEQLESLVGRKQVVAALPVRAAAAGTLVSFDRVLGQSIRADEPVFEVHDGTRPWVRGFVSEAGLGRVRIGQRARVQLVGNPGEIVEGTVARSGRTVQSADRSMMVWVELDADPKAALRHNQMARMTLTTETLPAVLAVPLGAIVREGTRAFVFVQPADGTFDRRSVDLGHSDDRFAEVRSGLAIGEVIAVTAATELQTAYASVR